MNIDTFHSWEDYVDRAVIPTECDCSHCGGQGTPPGAFNHHTRWDEAVRLARQGWDEHRDEVDAIVTHVENQVDLDRFQTTFETHHDVTGGEVDLGRYLSGEPECMIESLPIRIAKKGRTVRLVVPFGYRASVSARQAIQRGAAIVALADLLAKAQHPVEVWATRSQSFAGGTSPTQYHANILVQRSDEPLDVNRLLFVFAHPAAYRRIGFAATRQSEGWPKRQHEQGWQKPPQAEHLGEQVENTHLFKTLVSSDDWSERATVEWIKEQLAKILD